MRCEPQDIPCGLWKAGRAWAALRALRLGLEPQFLKAAEVLKGHPSLLARDGGGARRPVCGYSGVALSRSGWVGEQRAIESRTLVFNLKALVIIGLMRF
jgi:hypothetical protein